MLPQCVSRLKSKYEWEMKGWEMLTNHAAGGLPGDFWIASSRYGLICSRSSGVDVIVNPPAWGILGMWTSSHWPGRNCTVEFKSKLRGRFNGSNLLPWAFRQEVAASTSERLYKFVRSCQGPLCACLGHGNLLLFALHGLSSMS